jgi:hypothetical protein
VGLPDPWDLPNGTRFAGLLINGTAQREFRVDRPVTLRAQYAEVYYWAVVETPVEQDGRLDAKRRRAEVPRHHQLRQRHPADRSPR